MSTRVREMIFGTAIGFAKIKHWRKYVLTSKIIAAWQKRARKSTCFDQRIESSERVATASGLFSPWVFHDFEAKPTMRKTRIVANKSARGDGISDRSLTVAARTKATARFRPALSLPNGSRLGCPLPHGRGSDKARRPELPGRERTRAFLLMV